MRALNFTLLAVFSCVAMIGAAPQGMNRDPAETTDRRELYVV
jgi:hypothetical protein